MLRYLNFTENMFFLNRKHFLSVFQFQFVRSPNLHGTAWGLCGSVFVLVSVSCVNVSMCRSRLGEPSGFRVFGFVGALGVLCEVRKDCGSVFVKGALSA